MATINLRDALNDTFRIRYDSNPERKIYLAGSRYLSPRGKAGRTTRRTRARGPNNQSRQSSPSLPFSPRVSPQSCERYRRCISKSDKRGCLLPEVKEKVKERSAGSAEKSSLFRTTLPSSPLLRSFVKEGKGARTCTLKGWAGRNGGKREDYE